MSRSADVRFTFTPSLSSTAFEVVSFQLDESLSAEGLAADSDAPLPFHLAVELAAFDANVDFSTLLDAPAHFAIWRDGQVVRHLWGIITAWDQGDSGTHRTRYRAVIEPALARLTLRSNCRIFQQQRVPDIIGALLKEHGLQDVQWNLGGAHVPREFCCQWNESDWAFIQRIAADEGILLSVEHDANQHRLVFTDTTQSLPTGGGLIYERQAGGAADQPSLRRFRYSERMAPTRITGRDYTFWNARYNLEHQAAPYGSGSSLGQATSDDDSSHAYAYSSSRRATSSSPDYERYTYPGGYKRDEVGRPFTRTRLDAERRDAAQAVGEGDAAKLTPGTSYTLQGHPRTAWNRDWRVVRVHHEGTQHPSQGEDATEGATTYANTATFVPREAEWKAPLWTKPRLDGPLIATVVGPTNEQIYVDAYGRVKLQFPWDREGKRNDASSCWVRVSQGWAGTMYGMQVLPRIGHEVIVSFLAGDIDQPIVTGRAHHPGNLPPYELPKHKTRSTWKTQTHKGDGYNELRFEDEAGQEEIYLHAQKDHNVEVLNNETTHIGHDRQENVTNDETIHIGQDRTESVTRDEQVTVGNDRKHTVGQDNTLSITRNHTATIGKDRVEDVGNQRIDKTGGDHTLTTGGNVAHTVQGQVQLRAGQDITYTAKRLVLNLDEFLVNTPGGMYLINAHGAHFQGVAFKAEAGVIDLVDGSGGASVAIDGTPQPSLPVDLTDLLLSR